VSSGKKVPPFLEELTASIFMGGKRVSHMGKRGFMYREIGLLIDEYETWSFKIAPPFHVFIP
jgi:hypothetical protein